MRGMPTEFCLRRKGYTLRPARREDAEEYYSNNFCPLDAQAARLTGSPTEFSREAVISFFLRCVEDSGRVDLLLIDPQGHIIGESVLNEYDEACRSANLRVAIFQPAHRGRGLGHWLVRSARDLAFGTLGLHRLSLEVFSFNPRAEHIYRKAGFRQEGVLRDAVRDTDGGFGDVILLAMLEDEWNALRKSENDA